MIPLKTKVGVVMLAACLCFSFGEAAYAENVLNKEQSAEDKVLIAFTGESGCADLIVKLSGCETPAFRMLLPELITADNLKAAVGTEELKRFHKTFLHTVAGEWRVDDDGTWVGVQTHPGVLEITTRVVPHSYYVGLTVTLRNLTGEPLNNLRANYCLGVNAGGGGWANYEFLPKSTLERVEDGQYWYQNVAQKGAYIHAGGKWVRLFNSKGNPDLTDAGIIAINNEAGTATVFMTWKAPVLTPWINNASACMHLRPQVSPLLMPDESATIHGHMGQTSGGLDDVWRLYQKLP